MLLFAMFIPATRQEMEALGWDCLDVVLVTGDSYIDHPSMGIAVIGHVLMDAGFRVGVIAQPCLDAGDDISRLGEPRLFWGVSAGSIDSLVANYTPSLKRRKSDDYTPGGQGGKRPDRAVIAYTNLIRRFFKNTRPIVLGGIEASLRRVAHYDFWSDAIRRSVLFDAKADILVYGMGEKTVLELAGLMASGRNFRSVRGICHIAREKPGHCVELPSFEEVSGDAAAFARMFRLFCEAGDAAVAQLHGDRWLVQNPPQPALTPAELDKVHGMDFERDLHPFYASQGSVRALETIRFSITTHRGCFGGCNFCSIAVHQGRGIVSRSRASIVAEARGFAAHREFKGIISDAGGPTANMYGSRCSRKSGPFACTDRRCLWPGTCPLLKSAHKAQIELLAELRKIPGVKKVFVASGIRHDLVMADREWGEEFLAQIVGHHVSGQLKIAPEHTEKHVLDLMGKAGSESLIAFKDLFYELNRACGKKQFLTYYLLAAHPGCTLEDMQKLKRFATEELRTNPEQVQIFTPLPSTWSAVMYYTGMNPANGSKIFVERDGNRRQAQKDVLTAKSPIGKKRRRP
jgi:uncharacterized radical SAM protein YgiQ